MATSERMLLAGKADNLQGALMLVLAPPGGPPQRDRCTLGYSPE
jgi:hypothetical protein